LRELINLASRALITLPETELAVAERVTRGHPVMAPELVAGPSAAGAGSGDRGRGRQLLGARAATTHGEPISNRAPAPAATAGSPIAQGALGSTASSSIAAAFAPDDAGKRPKEAFGLSRREREVLALIAEGRTNREIGERLFISQKTVGVHVGNILAKLGASGRVEAAMVAIRLELVPTPLAGRQALART
jgi:DNA-binding CsgD family transcriptional regulator